MKAKQNHITIFEHQRLRVGEQPFTQQHLHALQSHHGTGVPYYKLIHKGILFNQFVGVIQVGDLIIEVLPKADKTEGPDHWRNILISMLKAVGVFDIQAPSSSSLDIKSNFILDLYFELFIKEVEYLVHAGLSKKYRKTTGNTTALKGALQFGQHISKNLVHQERFFVRYTTYDRQHLLHQVLLETLYLLQRINRNPVLSSRISALLLHFPEVPRIRVTAATFDKIILNRKTAGYKNAVEISRLLLLNFHPDVSRGQNHVLAIMFDMNKLWEKFVYRSLRKMKETDTQIFEQSSKKFWKPENGYTSSIRPDIVIKHAGENYVLDTKWKNIGDRNPSPDDLRQLYVYHRYFHASQVALVYPGERDIKGGQYFAEGKTNAQLSEATCSIITIKPETSISNWQDCIKEQIFDHWIARNPKPSP